MNCPLCDSTESRSNGPVRLLDGNVAEARECLACGELWLADDDGNEVTA